MKAGKYVIGLMFQDFIVAPNASYPELHLYWLYQAMAKESHCCEIWFVLDDGTVLSTDLTEPVGNYRDFNFDFVVYCGHLPTLDVFKISLEWVSKNFISHNEAELFSLHPYLANATASMSGVDPFVKIHSISHRLHALLEPALVFHNHGAVTYAEPKANFSNAKLFYIAASQPLQRHGGLIRLLDDTDWVCFHGPKEQWQGIKNYKGSFPYDGGNALFDALSTAGICLALHSPIHVHAQTYTNRIVEAAAAGALVITDRMDVLEDLCGPTVFFIDTQQPNEIVFAEIHEKVRWVHANPEAARTMVHAFQQRLRERIGEGHWLMDFCTAAQKQKEAYHSRLNAETQSDVVDVLFLYQGKDIEAIAPVIDQIHKQRNVLIHLIVVCRPLLEASLKECLHTAFAADKHVSYDVLTTSNEIRSTTGNNSGNMLLMAKPHLRGKFSTFIYENVEWHADHLQRMIWEMNGLPNQSGVVYGHVHYLRDNLHLKHPAQPIEQTPGHFTSSLREMTDKQRVAKHKNNLLLLDSFHPITLRDLMEVVDHANFISASGAELLSSFELKVESRLPKGGQLYSKDVLEKLTTDFHDAIGRLDGTEHIFLLYLLYIDGQAENVRFMRYSSCGVRLTAPPPWIKGEKSCVRYSLYPHAPLNHSIYRRSTGTGAFQLYDALLGIPEFWSLYAAHGPGQGQGGQGHACFLATHPAHPCSMTIPAPKGIPPQLWEFGKKCLPRFIKQAIKDCQKKAQGKLRITFTNIIKARCIKRCAMKVSSVARKILARLVGTQPANQYLQENERLKNDCHCLTKDLYALNDKYQESLRTGERLSEDLKLLEALDSADTLRLIKLLKESKSQLRQDIMVAAKTNFKHNGFFVEFGACDGVMLSNTYLLEKQFGWKGILAEPAQVWHKDLHKNRSCAIDTRCVWTKTGEVLRFNEVDEAGLSTIDVLSDNDGHREERKKGVHYDVTTVSLMDLLESCNAPFEIDYLSIDTEGSEYDILRHMNFERYKIDIITCEHNFTPRRDDIHDLLTKKGYTRILSEFSRFDDWYILNR